MKANEMGFTRKKLEYQNHHQCTQQKKKQSRFGEDKDDLSYQRHMWDDLQRRINTLINDVNTSNIRKIVQELMSLDLIKGRGLFCRAILESLEACKGPFVPVLAAIVAAINVEFPDVGYLLLKRIVFQLKNTSKKTYEVPIVKTESLIAHLVNQSVVHGSFALGLLMLLLQDPWNEASVETAVSFLTECGYALQDLIPRGLDSVFECLGAISEEEHISNELQCRIKGLFHIRMAKFVGCIDIPQQLDIVNLDDQVTHAISFHYGVDPELSLDVFSPDARLLALI